MKYINNINKLLILLFCTYNIVHTSQLGHLQLLQTHTITVPPDQLPEEVVENILEDPNVNDKNARLQEWSNYYASQKQRRYVRGTIPLQGARTKILETLNTKPNTTMLPVITMHDYSQLKIKPNITVKDSCIAITADVTDLEQQTKLFHEIKKLTDAKEKHEQLKQHFQLLYKLVKEYGITN